MKYLNFESKYDKYPTRKIEGYSSYQGYMKINELLKEKLKDKSLVVFETYPGVNLTELENNLFSSLNFDEVIKIDDYSLKEEEIQEIIKYNITDDRVFGVMSHFDISTFYPHDNLEKLNKRIEELRKNNKRVLVYGFGATQVEDYDELIYCDLARWEAQMRFRKGSCNWKTNNPKEDNLKKFKRGYFFEWRMADRIKERVLRESHYYLDTNLENEPKLIETIALFKALEETSHSPFRLVPYFDPGVWGGQWMKEVCNLDPSKKNYAWSFDGVMEENSLYFDFNGVRIETPSLNLVLFFYKELLGPRVYGRFGKEYPIRFDFLDTMDGGNLSLQVHPLTEYIQKQFGMNYTQDESYYILDCKDDACVYLGVKENCNKSEMINDLKRANKGEIIFDDTKYVNKFKVKKHDHILIPAGTVHCSGKNVMVLEVSSTPYIFTFKLWDWGRLGLDGLPRPVHINHGEKNIQFDRDTKWVKENLINNFREQEDGSILTGLDIREPLGTKRYSFNKKIKIYNEDSCNSCNLVEGKEAVISSINGEFSPFTVHYAETFIIPHSIKEYYIEPKDINEECMVLKAYVR